MKVDEPLDPMGVSLLRAQAVVLEADPVAHEVEQASGLRGLFGWWCFRNRHAGGGIVIQGKHA